MRFLLIVMIVTFSAYTYAGDDSDKVKAAKRYLAAAPISLMLADAVSKIAVQIPEGNRARFIKLMTEEVDVNKLELLAIDAMVKTFTLEELNAFADFYGSDVGRSATSKFGTYMSIVAPVLQQEMARAIKKAELAK